MATIRVRDWTKEQIEKIRDAESHSSHDSVIKSLLKDRELAKFAGEHVEPAAESQPSERTPSSAKQFDDLTVLNELSGPDNGVLFLWCPNCATEIAHLTVDGQVSLSVFEMECQHCLSNLDQHAIVAIEIGYPIERKLTDDALAADLEACVVDYWDRTLARHTETTADEVGGVEDIVWQFGQYVREFAWDWPADVPVVGFEAGQTYRDTTSGELVRVVEPVTDNRNALDSFEVERAESEADLATAEGEIMDSSTVVDLIASRSLELVEHSTSTAE